MLQAAGEFIEIELVTAAAVQRQTIDPATNYFFEDMRILAIGWVKDKRTGVTI